MAQSISRAFRWTAAVTLAGVTAAVFFSVRTEQTRLRDRSYRIGWEPRLPFQERGKDGRPTGLAVELVREAARRIGVSLVWVQADSDSETSLRAGVVDLWPVMVITPARRKHLHISEPYLEVNTALLVRAESAYVQSRGLETARIAYPKRPIWDRLLQARFPASRLLPQPDLAEMLEALCRKQVDGVFAEEDLLITTMLNGPACPDEPAHPPLRLIPVLEIRPRMGVGSTFEARAVADAIRDEISDIAIDTNLAQVLSHGTYASFRQVESLSEMLAAQKRSRRLGAITAGCAALLILAVWQAWRVRSERNRARGAERSMRETEQKLRRMADSLKEMVLAYDMSGRLIYANPAAAHVTGYSIDELAERGFASWAHPDDRPRMLRHWDELSQGGRIQDEEYKLLTRDGRVRRLNATWGPVLDEAGRQVGVQGSEHDITEQRELQARLEQVQRLESIGRLAGGVAHDFNNLLTVINGYGTMLANETETADPSREPILEIVRAGERAARLTQQLLAFSRRQMIAPVRLCLNDVVVETQRMLRRLIGEDIELEIHLAPDLQPVTADAGQMHQVLLNLAVNARDAMPKGGRVLIATANVEVKDGEGAAFGDAGPGRHVQITFADTGVGIGPEVLPHIFEPFFTTKQLGVGTGLGLATVYGIVKQNGGAIWVESAPQEGAAFRILLPVSTAEAASGGKEEAALGARRGTETILIAEDNAEVRGLARRILSQLGYHVLEAADAEAALELVEGRREPIHVLLTDVVLPGRSGKELAVELRRRRPQIRCVYMSGYTADVLGQRGVIDAEIDYLQKPFTPSALAAKVQAVLERAARAPS
jgi:PAS domain S-box-containing protein